MSTRTDEIRKSDASSNFGAKGWMVIIITGFTFFMAVALQSDGLNITIPAFIELHGWDPATLYGYTTIAGWIGVVGAFFWGWISTFKGPRFMYAITFTVIGVAVILWGRITAPIQYLVCFALMMFCVNGCTNIATSNIIANWFPRKKGVAMGWATMGTALSTIFYIAFLSSITEKLGISGALMIVGIVILAVGVISVILVRDHPEQVGAFPDNEKTMTTEDAKRIAREADCLKKSSPWTLKTLLKTKQVWQIFVGLGILMMISLGVMSSIIPRLTGLGIPQERAILVISIGGALGLLSSYLWGWIDSRYGTKIATATIFLWFILAVIISLVTNSPTAAVVSAILMVTGSNGANNMTVSMTISVFGRFDFAKAFAFISPASAIIRTLGYTLVGYVREITGGYFESNIMLVVLAVVGLIFVLTLNTNLIGRTEVDLGIKRRE